MTTPEKLFRCEVYQLYKYYYEPGEHFSGYVKAGKTIAKKYAEQFASRISDSDYKKERKNKYKVIPCYSDREGSYYEVSLKEINIHSD